MGISDALGLSKPAPPPAAAATYMPGDDLVRAGEVAPLNAGKTVGDTKPNAVEPPPPIEFIHFGRLHKSRANVFPHPKYEPPEKPAPGTKDDAASESKGSSAPPPGSTSTGSGSAGSKSGSDDELHSNPLFRKQAEKNDADWLKNVDPTPGTDNAPVQPAPSPEEAAKKDAESKPKPDESPADKDDIAPDGPAGQAVLMRDALLRESILLRNFVASTVAVHKEWKAGQTIPNPFAPKGDCLDHVKTDVGKAAKAINTEDAAYADLHGAGLELHRARATHAAFADDELDGYFGKPLPGLDKLMPDVPGLGPLLKPMFFMTLNTYGVYYRVYLAIRRAYEPVIEEICRRRTVAAILDHEPEPYDVWASEGGENAIAQVFARIVGQTDLPEVDPPPSDDQSKKDAEDEDDEPIGEDALDVPPAAELVAEAMAVACKTEKLGDPIGIWVRKWVQWDAESLEKVYKKLPETLKTPDKAIDAEFVQGIIAPSTTAKTLKAINCTFDLIVTSLRAASAFKDTGTAFVATCKAGLDHDEMPEVRAAKARSEYTEERGKLEDEAKKPESAASAGKKLKDLDDAEKAKVESEKGEMKAAVAKGDITQSEYDTWLKARTEDAEPDAGDKMDQYLKELEKYRDDIKSAVEKLNELTITAIATDLEAARAEAAGAKALTMEAYLGRLPRLLALLTLNTTMIAWKLALGGIFDVILRDVDTEITREIKSFREGDNFAKKFAKDKAGEENVTKAEEGATKVFEGVKDLYKAAHKDEEEPAGFPPDERVLACTGQKITKKDRKEAADQVRKTDSPKGKVDKPPTIFLKVE
ncbi:MAG: hypothetical protein EA378_04905 [Phycisphaerales bacterium]|nr:MAG: hypothetical protein EA378_04905 [Phycisphaerales bacterium]